MTEKIKYNCIFGGGGIRGMCYIGAFRALKECDIDINAIAGSSVGSVFAALIACGYDDVEIQKLFLDFNFNMFRDLNINIFTNDISLSKGEIFLDWLREKIEKKVWGEKYKKGNNPKVKFKDIDKDLYILTIDITTNTPYIFSKETTPEAEIALAVRASSSLPGLMKPVNIDDSILVDGDLIKSWPAWKIYNNLNTPASRILEFRLEGSRDNNDIKNPIDYINSIINTIWYLSTENIYNSFCSNDRYDYIVIDTKDIILFDFTIDRSIKNALIEKGYNLTKQYFNKTLVEKKKNILLIYKNIEKKLKILDKSLNQKNINNAVIIINDILSEMYENTKYIDISIYNQIRELKENMLTNVKRKFLFSKKTQTAKQIEERNQFIIKLIEMRIKELTAYIKKF